MRQRTILLAAVAGLAFTGITIAQQTRDPQNQAAKASNRIAPSPHAQLLFAQRITLQPNIAIDYLDRFNAPALAANPNTTAWPIYLEAIRALKHDEFGPGSYTTPQDTQDEDWSSHPDLTPEQRWQGVIDYYERHAEAIKLIRKAANRREHGLIVSGAFPAGYQQAKANADPRFEIDPSADVAGEGPPFLINVLLPHLSDFRNFARALKTDTIIAAQQGDPDRAFANIAAMDGIAAHSSQPNFLINQLVGFAITSLRDHLILELLEDHPDLFTAEHLEALADELGPIPSRAVTPVNLDGERAFLYDFLQRFFSDDGNGNGVAIDHSEVSDLVGEVSDLVGLTGEPAAVMSGFIMADRATHRYVADKLYSDMEQRMATPLWQRGVGEFDREIREARQEINAVGSTYFINILLPAVDRAGVAAERTDMTTDATRTMVAVARYKQRTGRYPTRLAQLIPNELNRQPIDRFTGQPLKYRLDNGKPLLYGVGVDRDDDNGRPSPKPNDAATWRPLETAKSYLSDDPDRYDGDWVLYPPTD